MPLVDNHPDDADHKYEVHVYTGFRSNAGTDSKISMIVAGTESDSGVRKLDDGVRNVITKLSCILYSGGSKGGQIRPCPPPPSHRPAPLASPYYAQRLPTLMLVTSQCYVTIP